MQGSIHLAPQRGQHIGREILAAHHWRRIVDQGIKVLGSRRCDLDLTAFGRSAQGGDIARGKITPPGPCGGQNAVDFRRAQMQQAMPRAKGEGICQPQSRFICQDWRGVLRHREQVSAGRQVWCEHVGSSQRRPSPSHGCSKR
jgi:hypothetical protein